MTKVRTSLARAATGVPVTFVRIDGVTGFALLVVIVDAIEDKKLCFRTEVRHVRDARALQITFRPNCCGSRIESITLAGNWIDGVGDDAKSRIGRKRIHPVAISVGHQQHV